MSTKLLKETLAQLEALGNDQVRAQNRKSVYRDYPVSKGCTSPFGAGWINELVRRQA